MSEARVAQRRGGRDVPALERGGRGDELEGRAGGIAGLDRAVEQRLAEVLRGERVELLLRDRLREDVRVERGLRAERQHLAVLRRSSRRTRPCRCRPRAPAGPRAGRSRSSDSRSCLPWTGCSRFSVFVRLPSASTSTRAAPFRPRRKRSYSASIPALPTRSPIDDAVEALVLQLLGLTSPTWPNRCAPITPVRVLAQELALGLHPGELLLALEHVRHERPGPRPA